MAAHWVKLGVGEKREEDAPEGVTRGGRTRTRGTHGHHRASRRARVRRRRPAAR